MSSFNLSTEGMVINFDIPANKVLIVGDSGKGKTFLIKRLEGYSYTYNNDIFKIIRKLEDISKITDKTRWLFFDEIELCSKKDIEKLSSWILENNLKFTFIVMYRGGGFISTFSPLAELISDEIQDKFHFRLQYRGG